MFLGQYTPAMQAAEQMCNTLSPEVLGAQNRPQVLHTMEGYYSMKMHVLVRFGRWQLIIDTPLPSDSELYCVSTAMHHYAKGVAHAALKQHSLALQQRDQLHAAIQRIPTNRMLDGEMAYHQGDFEQAFHSLRASVAADDNLEYTEPWAWMHPPRHALAALLAEQAHYAEAEEIYRTDLGLNNQLHRCAQHPDITSSCLCRSHNASSP